MFMTRFKLQHITAFNALNMLHLLFSILGHYCSLIGWSNGESHWMKKKRNSSIDYVREAAVGLIVFLGGSGAAFYCLRNDLNVFATQALAVSSAGIVFAFLSAWKIQRSSSKNKILQIENIKNIKDNLIDAYLGFCHAEIIIGCQQDNLILPNTSLNKELQCYEDLNAYEQELTKKLKNVCLWDEINRYKCKPLSKDNQVLCGMEKNFSTVLAGLQQTLETEYLRYISHPRKNCLQRDIHKQIRSHISDYTAQLKKPTNEHISEPKGIKESTEHLLQAAETLLSNKDVFEVRDDCSICIDQVSTYVFYHGHADVEIYGKGKDGWTKGLNMARKHMDQWTDDVYTEPDNLEKFKNFQKNMSERFKKQSLVDKLMDISESVGISEETSFVELYDLAKKDMCKCKTKKVVDTTIPGDEQTLVKGPVATIKEEPETKSSYCNTGKNILTSQENSTNCIFPKTIDLTESDGEQSALEVEVPVITTDEVEQDAESPDCNGDKQEDLYNKTIVMVKKEEPETNSSDSKTEKNISINLENSTENCIFSKTIDLTESDDEQAAPKVEIPVITIDEVEQETESSDCNGEKQTITKGFED